MVKNERRNEIIRILRKYERLGLTNEGLNPLQVYKKIDVLCVSRRTKLDMLAVFDTLRALALQGDEQVVEALDKVYFAVPSCRLTKNEISRRVFCVAQEQHCDERTVYRRLEKARRIYEEIRAREGLLWDGLSAYSLRKIVENLDKTTKNRR